MTLDSLNCTFKMSSKLSLLFAICLFNTIQSAVHSKEILDRLTDAEIQKLFHKSRNEIPNYKTVMLENAEPHRSKRETRPVEFVVDGKKVQLSLNPVKHNVLSNYIPVWTVETAPQRPSHQLFQKADSKDSTIDGEFYEDLQKMATLLAYYKDNFIFYDGIFGESRMAKVVRSVPEKWWKRPGTDLSDDHIIFDVDKDDSVTKPLGEIDDASSEGKLEVPLDVMYPKLLLVIEHNYFKSFGEDVAETLKYVATFWNAVNLQYSKLTSPKVKIVITGVIIAKDDTALRYIYESRNQTDMSLLNSIQLLKRGDDYFQKDFGREVQFHNYDSTMTMTNLNTGAIAGSAYYGKICASFNNIGFVNDDANFGGLQAATHELGHLLNLLHDGTKGYTEECSGYPEDNVSTIMAPFVASVDKYIWSDCSKRALQKFASKKTAECMRYPSRSS